MRIAWNSNKDQRTLEDKLPLLDLLKPGKLITNLSVIFKPLDKESWEKLLQFNKFSEMILDLAMLQPSFNHFNKLSRSVHQEELVTHKSPHQDKRLLDLQLDKSVQQGMIKLFLYQEINLTQEIISKIPTNLVADSENLLELQTYKAFAVIA